MTNEVRPADRRGFPVAALLLPFLCLALLRKLDDYDLWYHLVIGRRIFETSTIPGTEFFIYPLLGEPAAFHEWGFELLFYLASRWTGSWGMGFLNALIGALALFLLFRATEGDRLPLPIRLLGLAGAFWCMEYRLVYRPEMILLICLSAEIVLLERYDVARNVRHLLPIPLLSFVLSYFHPSSIFLVGVLGLYGAQFLWDDRADAGKAGRTALPLFAVAAVSLLAACLNPYFVRQVIVPFEFLRSGEVLKSIVEFLPTLETEYKWPFAALVAASVASLLLQPRRRISDVFLFLCFGYLGYRYVRNVALFALVMYVPIVRGLGGTLDRLPRAAAVPARRAAWFLALLGLASMLAVPLYRHKWGVGPFVDVLPVKSADHIAKARPPGRIFNYYHTGGYLAWRLYGEYLVLIDGRHYEMDRSFRLHNEVFSGVPGWQGTLAAYGVGIIVTPATLPFKGGIVPLVPLLAADPDWALVETEPGGLLFVRTKSAAGGGPVVDKREIWRQAIREARLTLKEYPGRPGAHLALGQAHLALGDYELAAAAYRKYLAVNPADREAAGVLSLLQSYGR